MISEVQLDANERVILKINRTLVGLVPLYALAVLIFSGLLLGIFLIAKNQTAVAQTVPVPLAVVLTMLGSGLFGLLDYVFIKVYLGNKMVLTSERLVALTQNSLFHQSVPQLNLADIQEVTVHQAGIFSHLFSYGTIVIETAGEQKNLILKYAVNPHDAVKEIEDAAEVYKSTDPRPELIIPVPQSSEMTPTSELPSPHPPAPEQSSPPSQPPVPPQPST